MNYFSASGQSRETTTIDNETLTKYVRTCDKCLADNVDLKNITTEQKLIIETQGIRIIELENTVDGLNGAIKKLRISYDTIVDATEKKKFWVWIKGVGIGIVTGAAIIILLMI